MQSESRACVGSWRSSSWQRENVPKSCSSRSLRSVRTTSPKTSVWGASKRAPRDLGPTARDRSCALRRSSLVPSGCRA